MIHSGVIRLRTRGHTDIHDLTPQLEEMARASGIEQGILVVHTPSSTSAITTIEYEEGALDDLRRLLDEVASPEREYRHNLRWHDGNGHAHLRAALLGPSLTVPLVDGRLALGTWQQVIFLDFDVRPRQREILVRVLGAAP
jgi:secondary thiamine-phosphate synthase enzyme